MASNCAAKTKRSTYTIAQNYENMAEINMLNWAKLPRDFKSFLTVAMRTKIDPQKYGKKLIWTLNSWLMWISGIFSFLILVGAWICKTEQVNFDN